MGPKIFHSRDLFWIQSSSQTFPKIVSSWEWLNIFAKNSVSKNIMKVSKKPPWFFCRHCKLEWQDYRAGFNATKDETETNQLIYNVHQLTGFYMMEASVLQKFLFFFFPSVFPTPPSWVGVCNKKQVLYKYISILQIQ